MFKYILPQESKINSFQQPSFDNHFQQSAFKPLATAIFAGFNRLKLLLSNTIKKNM